MLFMVDVAGEAPQFDALLVGLGESPGKLRKTRSRRRRLQTTHVSNAPRCFARGLSRLCRRPGGRLVVEARRGHARTRQRARIAEIASPCLVGLYIVATGGGGGKCSGP